MLLGEVDRRQAFRSDGASAVEPWAVERFGVSAPTARALAQVGEKAPELPHLLGTLCDGGITFDKVRVLADIATPENDAALCTQALEHSVRELADVARTRAAARRAASARPPADADVAAGDGDGQRERRTLRINGTLRTMTVQLPEASFAEARTCLETRARAIPSDGGTPWDQRLADAFLDVIRSSSGRTPASAPSPFFVVAHVPFDALVGPTDEPTALGGELERGGMIDVGTVRRIACDATVAVAVDDEAGHTMYEGRAKRFATKAQRREIMRRDRHCRFPGCDNVTFAHVHHVVEWDPGGRTDLDNLALLCEHHHGVVHRKGWTVRGNANDELEFRTPTGRVTVSRPSPRWTTATDLRRQP